MSDYLCTATELAHYTVDKCTRENCPVSNLQLQKILYFLQLTYCRASKGGLLFEEPFQAWPYGPVIESVYNEYSFYGASAIEETYDDAACIDLGRAKGFVDAGISRLRTKYPWEMVRISHAKGSPWDLVWRGGRGRRSEIPRNLIRSAALG